MKRQDLQPTLKISKFTCISSASQPASLPAVRPGCARCRAPEISHNKGNGSGFTKMLFRRRFTHCVMAIPFILHSFPCSSLLLSKVRISPKVMITCNGFCLLRYTKRLLRYTKTWLARDIKTHDSESRGQEEAGRTRRTSELFTRSTALKLVNALNKPP